jgi:hypothetical protein
MPCDCDFEIISSSSGEACVFFFFFFFFGPFALLSSACFLPSSASIRCLFLFSSCSPVSLNAGACAVRVGGRAVADYVTHENRPPLPRSAFDAGMWASRGAQRGFDTKLSK